VRDYGNGAVNDPVGRSTTTLELSPAWIKLVEPIPDRHQRSFMNRLARFCSKSGIEPAGVTDKQLADFEHWARSEGQSPSRAKQLRRDVVKAWNSLSETGSEWPKKKLALIDSRPSQSVSLEALPRSFAADLDRFLDRSGRKSLFDTSSLKPLASVTQNDRRLKILQMTTLLIESGVAPSSIASLSDLVSPVARTTILETLWGRCGQQPNGHFYNLARLLTQIARHWAKVPAQELELFKAAEAKFRPDNTGMTEKNEHRLRVFIDPANVRKIVRLAPKVFSHLNRDKPSVTNATEAQSALAVALLLIAPIRIKNLAALDLERNVHRVRDDEWFLVIPSPAVKNKQDLTFPIPQKIVELFRTYLDVYRPLLLSRESQKIFVSWNGREKKPDALGKQIMSFIERHTGLTMNPHLFRHFAAYLYLRANPGHYEPVRQLLGHREIQTTTRFYTKLEQADTFRKYDQILDSYRKELPDEN
jgi:integrase